MSKKNVTRIVLVEDDHEAFGLDSVFKDVPVLLGSTLYMRRAIYDRKKYAGIPVDRGLLKAYMTYEAWKEKVREANDEAIAAGKKLAATVNDMGRIVGVSRHEAVGFLSGEMKRAEREIEGD